ncbi:MAG: Rho termination factor N-terminal domain-containing protein [Syntrophales bacterium]|nr:Rho termination factor N-terminal domain-containing protein [Syntrophales bacterium]MDY0044839.1 Rho termination factor N-terminal domain-containing protein [Syntrophales bacterium]
MAEEKPLEKMTVKDLREIALGIDGLEGVSAMKKADLITAIKVARGIPVKKTRQKTTATVIEIKNKIRQLREKKQELRSQADKAGIKQIRRRISRLKKKTRKFAGVTA